MVCYSASLVSTRGHCVITNLEKRNVTVHFLKDLNRGCIIKTVSVPHNMLNKIKILLLFMLLLPRRGPVPALGHAFCVTFMEVA